MSESESTIVVGIDGSPAADHALAWARAFGARAGAAVRAVMTWDVPAHMVSPGPIGLSTDVVTVVEDSARAALDATIKRADGGPGPVTTVLRHGPTVPTLLGEAEEHDADLVVVGTRGLGPIRRVLMGSVSARVARDSLSPVAVVPPGAPLASDGPVVVGVDGSAGSIAALRWAAETTDGTIHAVHVMEYPFGPEYAVDGFEWDDPSELGEQVLQRSVDEALGDRPEVTTTAIGGDPRQVLVDEGTGAALIVVGARGAGGIGGLLLGSITTGVAGRARTPVVVVPDR